MKKENIIYIALGIAAIWYLMKKKKVQPGGNLSSMANQLANEQAKNINFVPDQTSFQDEYKKDLKNCR